MGIIRTNHYFFQNWLLVQSVSHQRTPQTPRRVLPVSPSRLSTLHIWLRLAASLPGEGTDFKFIETIFPHAEAHRCPSWMEPTRASRSAWGDAGPGSAQQPWPSQPPCAALALGFVCPPHRAGSSATTTGDPAARTTKGCFGVTDCSDQWPVSSKEMTGNLQKRKQTSRLPAQTSQAAQPPRSQPEHQGGAGNLPRNPGCTLRWRGREEGPARPWSRDCLLPSHWCPTHPDEPCRAVTCRWPPHTSGQWELLSPAVLLVLLD